jgi:TolB-like protein
VPSNESNPTPESDPPRSLFGEIRRRRVFRVAGAYVIVAWILMQAGEIVFPAFELPNSALRLLILCLIAGLPCVIVLAWILDVTPTGIRLTRRFEQTALPGDESDDSPSPMGRSLEMILLGICIPIFGFAVVLVSLTGSGGDEPKSRDEPRPRPIERRHDGIPALAVLPFDDLSSGATDDGFFARGMHEDILTHLARVQPLRLISRTSVMNYAGTTKNLRSIGEELGVDHILEGSVRRTPTQVRVNAQLIRVDTDEHMWAESFDSDLSDVFAVQDRIAKSIATALAAELVPNRAPIQKPSPSVVPAAYDAYLKARDIHRNLDSEDQSALARARHFYELALQTDDTLAAAWMQLSILHAQAYWFRFDPSEKRSGMAREALRHARELGVQSDQLELAEGILSYYVDQDYGMALLHFKLAAELAPGNAEAHFYQGMILRRLGQLEDALVEQSAALDLDPLNLGYRDEYALTLALAGHLAEARNELRDILREDPDRLRARFQKWQLDLELDGRPQDVLREILGSSMTTWRDQHYSMLQTVAVLAGEPRVALEIFAKRPQPNPDSGYIDYQRGVLEGFLGDDGAKKESLAVSQQKYRSLLTQRPGILSEDEARQVEALFAMQEEDFERAITLQTANVESAPIEQDLIVGAPTLWLLLHIQLVAGRIDDAIETLDRLRSRVSIGSILYGGYYVLDYWPAYEKARSDPRWSELLRRLRPEYAERWPAPKP